MGHDWVFDVLNDLKAYALANGFVALAAKVDEVLEVAAAEIGPWAGIGSKMPDGGLNH